MQGGALAIEREATHRLPEILAELLDEPGLRFEAPSKADGGVDLVGYDERGHRWVFQIKVSSQPGRVADVASQMLNLRRGDTIPVIVVPYMSPAGARAAEEAGLSWIDLSGNAHIRGDDLYVRVEGRANQFRSRGRPSSPFAPKSARVTRVLLEDPGRWWRQKELVTITGLDDGSVSRIVRRLDEDLLLERRERELRPRDPGRLLDAWAQDYRFAHHDILTGHISGSGIELARDLAQRLEALDVRHSFTGLPAAWAIDHFARFRLTTVYVEGDPRDAAKRLVLRQGSAGANVQFVGPDDLGVFIGEHPHDGINCVSPEQVYLDLLHLPERAREAAEHLRHHHLQYAPAG
ncbi:MAG: type IV toxin-antitoxin system AbiEi family antitoxin [Solirubrobacteraceae bacterium]